MMNFSIDARDLKALEINLENVKAEMPGALARALNKTGDIARTAVKRELVKQTSASYAAISDAITTMRATGGGRTYAKSFSYVIQASGKAMPLSDFAPHQTGKGVSVRVWGKRQVLPHTFMIPNAGSRVFERTSHARLPIRQLWGPSLPQELLKDTVPLAFENAVHEHWDTNLKHELDFAMGKLKSKR